jgi:hypothetical protein
MHEGVVDDDLLLSVNPCSNRSATARRASASTPEPVHEVVAPLVANRVQPVAKPLPVRFGVPLPRGELVGEHFAAAVDFDDERIEAQATPLARWSDGSVRWLLVDVLPTSLSMQSSRALLRAWRVDQRVSGGVEVRQSDDAWIADTGNAVFRIDATTFRPIRSVEFAGGAGCIENAAAIELVDAKSRRRTPTVECIRIESAGPVRTVLRASGAFTGSDGLRWSARIAFFAGSDFVCLRFAIHNPHAARHRGGIWDLGDRGSRFFRSLDLTLKRPAGDATTVRWRIDDASPLLRDDSRLAVYQGSSGGRNWQSRNHVDRHGRVPCVVPGYVEETSRGRRAGQRAMPVVACEGDIACVTAAVPNFWQQFPKAIDAGEDGLRIGLFPGRWSAGGSLFELQGGERKTHAVWMSFGNSSRDSADSATALPLDGVFAPLRLSADPAWIRDSRAIDGFVTQDEHSDNRFGAYAEQAVAGPWSVAAGRETIDEYGWRNFGDIWANHEALYYIGPAPIISHYNNQFDYLGGAILQWLQSGDERWRDIFEPLAEHVMDIDRYHTERDRAAYNGGLFWFTDHYLTAATATHRTYSKANATAGKPYGGGPGSEHIFATGLLHYYCLTGDEDAREAVIGLADWVIAMDDGRRTIFRLVDDGPTGLASAHWSGEKKCPGRGAANSIQVLLDAWLLCGESRYMAKAEELIRRSIHPRDDIAAMNLLDAEKHWSYTMFLAAIDRFLSVKAEAGQIDDAYAYAQASFANYARWMLEHERPYLEEPEKLEYPTEAWAAQEFRKANVMRRAARHVDDADTARRLVERGTSLAERAWRDLVSFDTQATARAMAMLLTEGMSDTYLRTAELDAAPRPPAAVEFGEPTTFESQRARVKRRMKSAAGLVGLVGAALSFPLRRVNSRRD